MYFETCKFSYNLKGKFSLCSFYYPSKKPSLVPSFPPLPFPPSHFLHQLLHQLRYHFFWQVGKCYIWLRPYRWGLRFGTYLGWNFRFGLWSRGQNVSKLLFVYTNAQIGSIRSCSNGLKFGMNIGLYMGQILSLENLVVSDTKKGFIGVRKVVFDRHRWFFAFFSTKETKMAYTKL